MKAHSLPKSFTILLLQVLALLALAALGIGGSQVVIVNSEARELGDVLSEYANFGHRDFSKVPSDFQTSCTERGFTLVPPSFVIKRVGAMLHLQATVQKRITILGVIPYTTVRSFVVEKPLF
jgi:hypothetical protein